MNVLLFGATGMVGQGVLRECLLDRGVESVTAIGRSTTGVSHPKLREIVHADLINYEPVESQLSGFDACFFCLGISSAGLNEELYSRITYDITLRAAETIARLNPNLTFAYVSGQGTDSSEHGRIMWARVKGRTENALLRLPFKAAFMFRPGIIVPRFGARSRTALYRIPYMLTRLSQSRAHHGSNRPGHAPRRPQRRAQIDSRNRRHSLSAQQQSRRRPPKSSELKARS